MTSEELPIVIKKTTSYCLEKSTSACPKICLIIDSMSNKCVKNLKLDIPISLIDHISLFINKEIVDTIYYDIYESLLQINDFSEQSQNDLKIVPFHLFKIGCPINKEIAIIITIRRLSFEDVIIPMPQDVLKTNFEYELYDICGNQQILYNQ